MEKTMKKTILTAITALGIILGTAPTIATESISSLRGDHDLNADAVEATKKKEVSQKGGFERSYKQQPPMVPHSIEKDTINLKGNTCLKCHSKATAEKEKAPVAGESHFLTRDGKTLEKISSRRYFCNQCHAPQVVAQPLVENTFEGAK
jgi:cytochrome c-type protein NapB